jgi:Na+/H+ antiporter NhaD/arsenite permease-like protein
MIGLAVMANIQGTATLIGDPPSMIFADFAHYSFNDFFFRAGRPSIFFAIQLASIIGALYFFFYFRSMEGDGRLLPAERIVSWVPAGLLGLMIAGLAGLSALSAGSGIHAVSGIFVVGLAGIGLGWLGWVRKERTEARNMVRHLDWGTLAFLVGIFVVVGTVSESGLLDGLGIALAKWTGCSAALGFSLIIAFSVLVSGFVDNVPYIAAMLPVAAKFAATMGGRPELFMFALLIGSCIGGNLTPFGASANIVAVSLSEKNGAKVGFWSWVKIAGPFTILTTVVAGFFVWLVWR